MPRTPKVPAYSHHKPSGRAIVKVKGQSIYLGKYGSDESRENYARVVADLLAGRPVAKPAAAERGNPTPEPSVSVAELARRFVAHAEAYYRKGGEETSEVFIVRRAAEFLTASHADLPAARFTIGDLKAVRQAIVESGVSRSVVNKYVGRIRRAFTWAAAEELIPPEVAHALKLLPGLKAGRTEACESQPVHPVEADVVAETIKHAPEVVADMARLQLLTGMRPGEVCSVRPADVDRSADVWEYRPAAHKCEHHGRERVVFIGPAGQEILAKYLLRPDDEYCFRPKRHTPVPRAQRRYRVSSYRRAIGRACDKAKLVRWSPNRLRHTAATEIRRRFGVESAQTILGHSKIGTTQLYAQTNTERGREIAAMIG